ncbi:hypothetical protein BGX30_001116 [Mortierella sp. GBA39]|nr:hypothetical protein BGX30_001116 [Mortierella sp. GBA39]
MGIIKLDCLAVNPNNTIVYGIGNAYINGADNFTREKGSILLVRSEPNPTSFKSIKWTIVSIVQAQEFPYYWTQSIDFVDCAVSRTGIFTALALQQRTYQSQGSTVWAGIKFDPALGVKGANGSSQVGGSSGWEQFGTGNDYLDGGYFMSHAATYYDQRVKVQGGPTESVVKERFIHAVMRDDGWLRFGSFGPKDPLSNDTFASWNMNSSLPFRQAPKLMSLGQGYAHIYREEAGTITSYPLTDVQAPIPGYISTNTVPGLTLKHVIPGVRNGISFLACIGNKSMYFISNFLETNNTITTPKTSQIYNITTTSSTSTSLSTSLRPYLFVTSQYNTTDPSPLATSPIIQNTFHFGISLSRDGDIYGISLSGNSSSNTFGQTVNAGAVWVDAPYASLFGPAPAPPKEVPQEHYTPRYLGAILAGLAGGMLVAFSVYHAVKKRRNRKLRALEAERADASGRLGPNDGIGLYEPARYQTPIYGPQGQGQRQGQAIELTTPGVPFSQQQHRVAQPSARHDGLDAPPAYSA